MRRTFKLVPLFLLVLGLTVACTRRPSDDDMAKDIQTKVAADPDTKDSNVTVAVKEKKVTVTGKVPTPAARAQVEKIAHDEPGVADVDDQTTVAPELAMASAPPPPPVEPPKPIIVPSGTVLTVRLGQPISSKTSNEGDPFIATVAQPVAIGGKVLIPEGSSASGVVTQAHAAGRFKGGATLGFTLKSIIINGHTHKIQTTAVAQTSKGKGKRTAGFIGGGAAGGALIGGLAGGGKGAAIGALVGAGAGTAGAGFTGKNDINLPTETVLSFRLDAPLELPPGSGK